MHPCVAPLCCTLVLHSRVRTSVWFPHVRALVQIGMLCATYPRGLPYAPFPHGRIYACYAMCALDPWPCTIFPCAQRASAHSPCVASWRARAPRGVRGLLGFKGPVYVRGRGYVPGVCEVWCMCGLLYVWSSVCVASCMRGLVYVWSSVCARADVCALGMCGLVCLCATRRQEVLGVQGWRMCQTANFVAWSGFGPQGLGLRA